MEWDKGPEYYLESCQTDSQNEKGITIPRAQVLSNWNKLTVWVRIRHKMNYRPTHFNYLIKNMASEFLGIRLNGKTCVWHVQHTITAHYNSTLWTCSKWQTPVNAPPRPPRQLVFPRNITLQCNAAMRVSKVLFLPSQRMSTCLDLHDHFCLMII